MIAGHNLPIMPDSSGIDRLDLKIIDALTSDGRMSITDLSQRVGLSKSPCQARVARLRERGITTGFRAMLDPVKLGRDHLAFA